MTALQQQLPRSYFSPSDVLSGDSWASIHRMTGRQNSWTTSSQYAHGILNIAGYRRSPTDVTSELHSLLALVQQITSGQYADGILRMTGNQRTATDVASELHSLVTRAREAIISVRKDLAEQQIAKLDGMRGETEGWDGRQSAVPDATTIDLAASLLRRFAEAGLPIPVATVSPSGNAALFAHGRGVYADIELHADQTVSWLVQLPHGPELEDTEPFDGKSSHLRLLDILRHAPGAVA